MIPLLRKPRVLVLDDDPAMQRLVAALLRSDGYRADVVTNGRDAIDRLRKHEYRALLLDVMTPTEGGLTVIRHLRTSNPALLRRVVLVTASPDSVLRDASRDVFAVVKKPFSPGDLLATIQRVVES